MYHSEDKHSGDDLHDIVVSCFLLAKLFLELPHIVGQLTNGAFSQ